jgi:hypothetical protein
MTHPIPAEAITAATQALNALEAVAGRQELTPDAIVRLVLEAAQPHLAYNAGKTAGDRIAQLTALAEEILASYSKTGDGYRGRVGQVQIATWTARLDGER